MSWLMENLRTSCTLPNSVLESLQYPLAIVAHDAGAANHIIAWLRNLATSQMCVSVTGPALTLWTRAFPNTVVSTFSASLSNAKLLISGTGWGSSLEHDSRKMARYLGIKSVAVIDHWTNYRERFIRNGEEVLPDEIWVTDGYAKNIAEKEFPNLKVVQLPNSYLDALVDEVRIKGAAIAESSGRRILYVLEPIRNTWGSGHQLDEFHALDYFIEHIERLGLGNDVLIRLRPHPSDSIGKYDEWVKSHEKFHIIVEDSSSLAESIAQSDVVVGCQTYAMVVALAAGKRVVSSIPPGAPPCVLPYPEINKLADLVS